ncbi:MAG: hypothetical protein LBS00_11655 [Synergistaceae bacterium]|jgi:hypothetical protein|nr:hypothetical protein [Synergistaceae bacterium]
MSNPDKINQEVKPLNNIGDSFKKIVVVRENIKAQRSEDGIMTIGICSFLLDENSLNL